jgi:uncharacterized repeat protein (TIGR02059 family)
MIRTDKDPLDLHIAFDPLRGASAAARTELVFIDSDVPDLSTLLAGVDPGKEVHVIDAGHDGLQQIADILRDRSGIDALHLISHGQAGVAGLGSLLLDAQAAAAEAPTLKAIGASLNEGADILLYGCDVGAGSGGRLLLDQLAMLTGADLAASSDRTGAPALGGDWDLEVRTGDIEALPVVDAELAAHYIGTLALSNVTVNLESDGNFTNRGSAGGGAGSDVVYRVNGDAGYVLTIDGDAGSVYSFSNGGSNDYITVSTYKDVSLATISFSGGNVFTPSSLVVNDFSTSNQALTFKAYAGATLTGSTNLNLNKGGLHTVNFDGSFANITSIKITTTGSFDPFGLDDLVFSSIEAVDTTPPTVTGVTSSTPNGTYKIGDTIAVQVNFDETVFVTGTPQLTLETGSTDRTLNYVSGSNSSTLLFNYVVQAGDTSADLDYVATNSLALNSGSIKDAAGNAATLTLASPGAANSLGNNKAIVIDGIVPTVTDGRISISGASGTGGAFKVGDTVTATWNNTAGGDNNPDTMASVTVNFSAFGGGTAVAASNSSSTWTATYTIVAGAIDGTNKNVSVTATDAAGNATTTADTTNATVDNVAPTVTDSRISISGASGTGGAYKIGDTVTATWNNTAGGDNNSDTISGVTVDFSAFGGGAAVAASNSSGTWTATYTLTAGAIDGSNKNVSVTATDNAGNTTTTADTTNATVDSIAPTVTDGRISLSGASGTGGAFKVGDTVTATWNNTAGGDNNSDTISGVTVDFSQFGGGAAVAASNSSGTWTATYTLTAGAINGTTNRNVSVTATDNAGNTATTADSTNATVDNQAPTITFSAIALSADTGASSSDFITATAAQTISATLSGALGGGETVQGSLDNGSNWTDITSKVSGTTLTWTGATLVGSSTLSLKVSDGAGNDGTVASQAYTLDASAPSVPSTPDMTAGTDTGTSSTDNITASTTPTFLGTGEIGSTVTLYDTDGTTVLASATTNGSGKWSMTSSALSAGAHTVTVKASDVAGNVSATSSGLTFTVDTTAPTGLNLSSTTAASINTGSNATVATLSATDGLAITYSLAVGNGTNDADNGSFSISGTSLSVGGSALTAGTYKIYLAATDAAGNVTNQAFTFTVVDAPTVSSIVRSGGASATVAGSASSVTYTVTFSESVTGVDTSDFALTATGTAAGNVASISGSGTTYTVTVDTLSGDGTLRLDLNSSGTGIQNGSSIAIAGGYTSGSTYTLDHTAPAAPSTPDMSSGTDSGSSNSDDTTSSLTPTFSGTAEANSTVTLYDTDGTTVLGTATATGGNWSITSSTLSEGSHTLTAKASDAAGNVGTASSGLSVLIDATAPTATIASTAFSADTGSSSTDFITGTAAQTVSGTLSANMVAGELVQVSMDNGNSWNTATTTVGQNTWSYATTLTGSDTLRVRVMDTAGNAGSASSQAYVLDTTAPTTTVATAAFSADTGTSSTDFVTRTAAQTLSGTLSVNVVAGELVEISLDNGSTWTTATTTVGANTWSLSGITLAASDTLKVRVADLAGNTGTALSQAYVFDNSAPAAPSTPDLITADDSGTSSSDDITSKATPTFTGTAEANSVVTLYDTDGTTVLGTATATGGNWSITSSALSQGTHTLTTKATDLAGNTSAASSGLAVKVDTTAPTCTVTVADATLTGGETSLVTFAFSEPVTGFDNSDLTAVPNGTLGAVASKDGGQTWTATFTPTASVLDNTNLITLDNTGVADLAGNAGTGSTDSNNFTINTMDNAGPVFASAVASGSAVVLTYTDTSLLDAVNVPATAAFTVTRNGSVAAVASVAIDANTKTVALQLASPIQFGESVTVAYADPTAGNDANAIQDTLGNDAASLAAVAATNSVPDTAAPALVSAAVSGNLLTLAYADNDRLDSEHPPAASAFSVVIAGSPVAVASVSVAAGSVTLTLAQAALAGQAVSVSYADPSVINDAAAIQDRAGNDAPSFSNVVASNNTAALLSATVSIDDTLLTAGETATVSIVFSLPVTAFDLGDLGTPAGTLSSLASTDNLRWTATLTPAANTSSSGQVVTLNLGGVVALGGEVRGGVVISNAYAVNTVATGTTQDGVQVSTQVVNQPDGSTTTTQSSPPVPATRTEDPRTPNGQLADIVLAAGDGQAALLTLGLSAGIGFRSETSSGGTLTLRDRMVAAGQAHEPDAAALQALIATGIDAFLPTLANDAQVVLRTVSFQQAPATTSPGTVVINGAAGHGEGSTEHPQRHEAVVIDLRGLAAGTLVQLDQVEFALVIGAARITGGSGRNFVVGDAMNQFIVLGAEDDVLRGGGGDDTVGSKGGNDRLYGDEGNDLLVGGSGDDALDGGAGNDVLQGGASDAGTWAFQIDAQGRIATRFATAEALLGGPVQLSHVGAWSADGHAQDSDDRLAYSYQSADRLETVALLYRAAVGQLPSLNELNAFSTAPLAEQQLAQLAYDHLMARNGLQAAATEVRVKALIEAAWGAGSATAAWVAEGTRFISAGGQWTDGLLFLAHADASRARVTDAQGNLSLTLPYATSELGWGGDSGNDLLRGGAGNDRLVGGAGNDVLDGGSGTDTAVFTGSVRDYHFQKLTVDGVAQLRMQAHGGAEVDTLISIERWEIGSKTYVPESTLAALPDGVDRPLADFLVELTGVTTTGV